MGGWTMHETGTRKPPLWRRIIDFPLVALVIAVVLFFAASFLAYELLGLEPALGRTARAISEAGLNIGLLWLAYKYAIRHLGQEEHDDLPAKGAARETAIGVGIGFGLMTLIVGVAAIAGSYRIVGWGTTDDLWYSLASIALLPGFREELLFRGILFRWFEQFGGSWAALAITSALFGLAHIFNPNATWFSSIAIAVEAGVLLGGAYMLTRSLWMAIGLHAAWNFTQGALWDVPVSGGDQQGLVTARLSGPEILSGGAFGLEASIIALVIATVAGVALVVMAARRGRVVAPMWARSRRAER